MTAARPAKLRALTSNRPWSLPGVHETSARYRRFRDICEGLAAEFGRDVELTEAQRSSIRGAAMAALTVEGLQSRIINGESIDPNVIIRLAGASTRAIEAARAQMPAAPAEPSLAERIAARRVSQAATA